MIKPTGKPYPDNIATLTSLRFFAASFVVMFHFFLTLSPELRPDTGIVEKGYIAVDFFFILSGFILTRVYLSQIIEGSFSAKSFLIKRIARVYPLHIFTLLFWIAAVALMMWLGNMESFYEHDNLFSFSTNILLLHAWGFNSGISFNMPSWSISCEWFAYLLFPFMIPIILKFQAKFLLIFSLCLFYLFWFAVSNFSSESLTTLGYNFGIVRIFPEFVLGCALYLFGRKYSFRGNPNIAIVVVVGLLLGILHFRVSDAFLIPVFAAIIYLAAELSRYDGKVKYLTGKTWVYLGEISYAIYMIHYPVFQIIFILFKDADDSKAFFIS